MGGRNLPRSLGVALAISSGVLVALGAAAPLTGGASTPAATPGQSDDFAGYGAVLPTGTATQSNRVTARFTVPALNCATATSSTATLAESAGLAGGIGTQTALGVAGGVDGGCKGTTAEYVVLADAGHTVGVSSFAPVAGDRISISAQESSAGSKVTVTDSTQKKSLSESGAGDLAQLAAWGLAPGHSSSEIPTFTHVRIAAALNGANPASVAKADNLVDGTTVEVTTGAMSTTGTASGSFTETFKAN